MRRATGFTFAAVFGLLLAGRAAADPINVFGTGLDGSGGLLADGAVDSHYTVTPGGGPYTIGNPGGVGWVGNTATSQWISPATDTGAGAGPFTYTTTFDLTGLNPSTAVLTGLWSSDNNAQMFLNGNLVATDPFGGWSSLAPFSITSGFQAGVNTLTFTVPNGSGAGDGPTGLQVQIAGTADRAVPEPSTFALFGMMLALGAGCFFYRRQRMLAPVA